MVEGYVPRSEDDNLDALFTVAGPGYFKTMGTPIIQGRAFDERDDAGAPGVVIVNEAMARLYWPGQDPIGKRLRVGNANNPYLQVIGVAGDGKYITLGETPMPYLYLPLRQNYRSRVRLLLRSEAEPATLVAGVRGEVQALDETLPVFGVKTGEQFMERSLWAPETIAWLVSGFGFFALLLAAAGVYGVISYAVAQRTHEIGIRMALGARRGDVLRLVVVDGMLLVVTGIAIGLPGAVALVRVMESLLYDVNAADPITFALISLLLAGVALLACYIPARRATKVDPMIALRYE
jgi:putative ABC transport system permease protein